LANEQVLAKLTNDLTKLKNEEKQIWNDETNLRFEIKELDESNTRCKNQLGGISLSKATIEKSKSKNNKLGYISAAVDDSKKIKTKIEDISNLEKLIKIQETKLRKKRKELKAILSCSNIKLDEIAELSKEYKIELGKLEKQVESDRELAIRAGVPRTCLKNIQVQKLDNGNIEIYFCGIGSTTGIRNKLRIITESTMAADALVVNKINHALFLPLADCIGAVLYVQSKNILMLSHLGRHSLEQFGGSESVNFLIKNFNVEPGDITIWLSPSAGKENYPLTALNDRSLQEVAIEQFISAGVPIDNITKSNIDTTTNNKYYSHSQYLKGKRGSDGRFAIIATIES